MSGTIRKILMLLTIQKRRQAVLLLAATIVAALLEVLGIASIMPFMSLLTQPDLFSQNQWMKWFYDVLGFNSTLTFLIFVGVVVLTLLVFTNLSLAFSHWLMLRFVWGKHHMLSTLLLQKYLGRPYVTFLNRNSADLSKNILSETFLLAKGVFIPFLELIAEGISVIFILVLLMLLDPLLSIVVIGVLGGIYAVIYMGVRRTLAKIGKRRIKANAQRFKVVNEAFGGIKDIKLLNKEAYFLEQFKRPSKRFNDAMASQKIIGGLPHFALETLAFGSILLIVLFLMVTQGDISQTIPLLSLFAFAGYRLMPALRKVFMSATEIRFQQSLVELIHNEILEAVKVNVPSKSPGERMPFTDRMELREVSFAYPETEETAVRNINLTVVRNTTVALVGTTGSGKTTLLDIILGLLQPQYGSIAVDTITITEENRQSWQRIVGYVPQSIYLCDDSIARNIAFGVPDDQIDYMAVKRAAQIANLDEFIINDLPKGYDTVVGERGARLSGGQRQRIGIARALYHDPEVLLLDEATSSLDGITEEVVMEAIANMAATRTLIIIAHRLSTVRECHVIYLMEKGVIVDQGTYQQLIDSNEQFRMMAQLVGNGSEVMLEKINTNGSDVLGNGFGG